MKKKKKKKRNLIGLLFTKLAVRPKSDLVCWAKKLQKHVPASLMLCYISVSESTMSSVSYRHCHMHASIPQIEPISCAQSCVRNHGELVSFLFKIVVTCYIVQ
ncbi:hypothetical protein PVAP13_4KG375703 [Panicum virgatum]|uniref:Uncharacterized protein n=1 Tax=Panicum virgatum TaxID=38727 RepID=A0A8T0U1Y0_PANVG|nr:hypothetical protein PVAP13_4KG375703 [Panicum virgatum]